MLAWLLVGAAAVSGVLHIRAEYVGTRRQVYLFKPLTTSLILTTALLTASVVPSNYKAWVMLGLAFSLAGDVLLMLPTDRFVAGLISFLVAHLCYIVAFTAQTGFQWSVASLLPFLLYTAIILRLLWAQLGKMKLPVLVYMAVILVMGWQSVAQWQTLAGAGALLAMCGALLFIVSDSTLALNRFHHPFLAAQALVLSSYYVAQLLIALSIGFS